MPRILLVDDVRLFRHLEAVILGWRGYTIEEAASGEEALEKIRSNPPDLALVDLTMPGMSGSEVCEQVKQDPALQSIPIIIVASSGRDEDIRAAVKAGCDDYLTKPLDDTTLVTKVEDLLGKTDTRRCPRISTSLQISFEDFKGIFFEYTRDISRTGVFIEMANPLPIGTRLRLSFSLPAPFDHPVLAYARVVRIVEPAPGKPGGVGTKFIFLDENSERVIDALVSAQAEFEDRTGVFSRVSFQTDNAPIGIAPEEGSEVDILREEKKALQTSFKEIQDELMRLSARLTLIESLHSDLEPKDLLAVASDILGDLLGAESFGIYIHDSEKDALVKIADKRMPTDLSAQKPMAEPIKQVLSEGKVLIPVQPWHSEDGSISIAAAAPIYFAGKTRGVIVIHELYRQKTTLTSHDHFLLALLGKHVGLAMANSVARQLGDPNLDIQRIIETIS
jgi:CheY-like chemotaxis protein